MEHVFTPVDNNRYVVIEHDAGIVAVFENIKAALKYIDDEDSLAYDFTLMAVGVDGRAPSVGGRRVFHVIDDTIEEIRVLYLDKLDGYPYVMAGDPLHYDRNHTSRFNKCWGWMLADTVDDVQNFLDACHQN